MSFIGTFVVPFLYVNLFLTCKIIALQNFVCKANKIYRFTYSVKFDSKQQK